MVQVEWTVSRTFRKEDADGDETLATTLCSSSLSHLSTTMKLVGILVCLVLAIASVSAQPRGEQTLDREKIEWILQNIDADCKEEMQTAMANQGELSDRCKFTIQKMLMDKEKAGSASASTEPVSFLSDPITHVFLFLGLLFAGLGFYSFYAYDAKRKAGLMEKKNFSKKGKKWQKRNKLPTQVDN